MRKHLDTFFRWFGISTSMFFCAGLLAAGVHYDEVMDIFGDQSISGGPVILNEASSTSNPVFIPGGDEDSGVGGTSSNTVSLIASSNQKIGISANGVTEFEFWDTNVGTGACTEGAIFWDTGGATNELCVCPPAATWHCFTPDSTSDPTD